MGYFRKHYHPPGTAPGTLVEHRGARRFALRISLIAYSETGLEERHGVTPADCRAYLERPAILWVHIQGYPDAATLEALAGLFELHPLALEDVANSGQRPKLEAYDKQCFLILGLPDPEHLDQGAEQVSLFLGERYVLSFHPGADDPFEPVRQRLRAHSDRFAGHQADFLFYALLDRVIDQGFPVLERFGEEVEALETVLLERPDQATLHSIHRLRRDLLLLRRLFWPQRQVLDALLREEQPLIRADSRLFLRDCYDHSVQILELLESYRDMVAGMLEVYLTGVNNRLNDIMRLLTVISTLFMPLTFIVGVYGMNFGRAEPPSPWAMPELDWYYGYPLIWLAMAAIAVGMGLYFKRKRWL